MKKQLGALVLILTVLALLVVVVGQNTTSARLKEEIVELDKELTEAKGGLKKERERNGRLKRTLKDSYRAARSKGVDGQPSAAVAGALADGYHATAKSMRSKAAGGAKDYAEFLTKHGLAAELPQDEREALLAAVGNDQSPNRMVAIASFQDADAALKTLSDAVERDPDNVAAWAALARQALVTPGAGDTFTDAITELIALDPNNAYPYQLQAIQASKAGDLSAAYEAISAAALCDRSDDYQIEQIAYREALLADAGYSSGLARHLAIQGAWSQALTTIGDQNTLATSLAGFADSMLEDGESDLASSAYEALAQYASQRVGQSWTLVDELAAIAAKKKALEGLLVAQQSLGQDSRVAVTQFSLAEIEDRLKWIREITTCMSVETEAYTQAITQSDSDLAAYYDNVLKYGEAKAVEMALRTLHTSTSE
jgi:tetratricopeptide (TPR) repeat protein